MALREAELVACGEEAVGDCGWCREFVGFGEEGGCVAFADFEVPVCGRKVSMLEKGIRMGGHILVLPNPPP
jgi:hypothetical protein